MSSVSAPTRHLFFTGKGGVGKTALACATAISLADGGKRVLLVSTDPASNLDEMLGVALIFGAMWIVCLRKGRQIDVEQARRASLG